MELHFAYGGKNIAHIVKPRDSLLERCKSELWQELKRIMFPDSVVEEATKHLVKELKEFEARYPELIRSPKLKKRLVKNTLAIIALRYPKFGNCDTVTAEVASKDTPSGGN